ncbi:hypothetical protein DPMN_071773 [Dreissena polymorpha]|uniref:THAP-type domain-containing protein n=1 Tax=Dreissena polymorpha TaxID=45954 RepID=A0A9D3Z8D2_DREPO|nr:hypothetical protein DPMN_071773 [Dreissena polymorpha]
MDPPPPITRSPRIAGGYIKGAVGAYCCVPGCTNSSGRCKRKGMNLSFYLIPKDAKQKSIWLARKRRDVLT